MNNPFTYVEKLDKSMTRKEKLFFLNKIKWKKYSCVIDFGGANGRMLWEVDKYLTKHKLDKHSDINLINVEINPQFNSDYLSCYKRNYQKYASLKEALQHFPEGKKLIIFSSVMHELDSSTCEDLSHTLKDVDCTIVIRDMYWQSKSDTRYFNLDAQIFKLDYNQRKYFSEVHNTYDKLSFWYPYNKEKIWYEYLLKHSYYENWSTEVKEHYFNEDAHNLINCLSHRGKVTYCKYYILPYKKKEILIMFNFKMKRTTHIKLIIDCNNS